MSHSTPAKRFIVSNIIVGKFNAGIKLPPSNTLRETETTLLGSQDREQFLQFMGKMMQWAPEHRNTAKQLLEDPWLKAQL